MSAPVLTDADLEAMLRRSDPRQQPKGWDDVRNLLIRDLVAALRECRQFLADIEDWNYSRAQLPRRLTERFDGALGRNK